MQHHPRQTFILNQHQIHDLFECNTNNIYINKMKKHSIVPSLELSNDAKDFLALTGFLKDSLACLKKRRVQII